MIIIQTLIFAFIVYWLLVVLGEIWKIYSFDATEALRILDNSEPLIVAGYGHTSCLDPLYYIRSGLMCKTPIKCVAKMKYRWCYPWFFRHAIHFFEKKSNVSQIQLHHHLVLLVEGTRSYTSRLHSGFLTLAKRNKMGIIFFVNNYKKNKMHVSRVVHYDEISKFTSDDQILDILKTLIQPLDARDYARNPKHCSRISFNRK